LIDYLNIWLFDYLNFPNNQIFYQSNNLIFIRCSFHPVLKWIFYFRTYSIVNVRESQSEIRNSETELRVTNCDTKNPLIIKRTFSSLKLHQKIIRLICFEVELDFV